MATGVSDKPRSVATGVSDKPRSVATGVATQCLQKEISDIFFIERGPLSW